MTSRTVVGLHNMGNRNDLTTRCSYVLAVWAPKGPILHMLIETKALDDGSVTK
jgi:hypothetical protein